MCVCELDLAVPVDLDYTYILLSRLPQGRQRAGMEHQGGIERLHRAYLVTLMSCMGQYWCFTYYHCLFLYLVRSAGPCPDLPRGTLFCRFFCGLRENIFLAESFRIRLRTCVYCRSCYGFLSQVLYYTLLYLNELFLLSHFVFR